MKWPWVRRPPEPVDDLPKAHPEESAKAQLDAEAEREKAESKNGYIEWLNRELVGHGERNHFSEWLWESMRGKKT
jgi:hypothetical protein